MSTLSQPDPLLLRAYELLEKHLPKQTTTLWLKPPSEIPPRASTDDRFWQPWYPEHHRLKDGGWKPLDSEEQKWESIALFAGKQKEETLGLAAWALSHLTAVGQLALVVPNEYGGRSFLSALAPLGPPLRTEVGRKSRLFILPSPEAARSPVSLYEPVRTDSGHFSCPGLFSWSHPDRGSEILATTLSKFKVKGPVADLGAGWGYLATGLPADLPITLFEADSRGLECCRLNLPDRALETVWCDLTDLTTVPKTFHNRFSTAITNPPFHTGRNSEPVLGGAFAANSFKLLKKNGQLFLVGNSHLPYKAVLEAIFPTVELLADKHGYNVFRARK